ncbi:ferredoxin--NADP+ reductase [Actinobaculum suis]|uniref:ferredoxin--NADP(+) reductase n=1 Tax=Actinobaculum suis TaxID=1657 RepID=A0A1G7AYQ0_9ACTO|nr:FAD-dependent oxidoreductase [Actinobaculum suis]MDY5153498.1 FAD-dependent oxidoreductase [Actinobaculum suis]SDE19891.1 ferredoxin--NADP+ reductase [Actinobaculum suis]
MSDSLQVAIIGAGPAGIYAADLLLKTEHKVSIDIFDELPAPYGLVRYGVAPDHPYIRSITNALHNVLKQDNLRFFGNVKIGEHVTVAELHEHYDAVIVATGANADRSLGIPGEDLPGSMGGADFVSWYDGHPDHPRTWDLSAQEIAVVGVGNVALDITRMLVKDPQALESTDIPPNVEAGLQENQVRKIHIFGRRGPAQVKFSLQELRELAACNGVEVRVAPEDMQHDAASTKTVETDRMQRQVVEELEKLVQAEPAESEAPRQVIIHLLSAPTEIYGDGKVEGIRVEKNRLRGDGQVTGTGEFVDYPVQAVYRAIGYASAQVPGLPWDETEKVIPNAAGRIMHDGAALPGYYVTGWVKRGPVGLIGSTKSDAKETITCLTEDIEAGKVKATGAGDGGEGILNLLRKRGVRWTTREGWEKLDAYEAQLGEAKGRARTKVVDRETMTAIARGEK